MFSVADFGFTDLNDAIANIFASVNIATLPAAGRLSANGVAVTAGQAISVAEIVAGRLVFTPVAGASGNNYALFTFQVQDNGGIANAGIDLDPTPRTLTVNVVAPLVVPIGPGPVLPPVVITPPAPGPVTSTPPAATTTAPSTATPAVTSPAHTAAPVVDASPARAPVADPAAAPPTRADGPAAGGQASGGSAQPAAIGLKGPGMLGLQWFNVGNSDAPSFMSGVAANTPADFKLAQIVSSAVQQSNFEHALDKTREGVEEQAQQEERIVSSAIMGSTGLSVGYLVWLLRSGALISSLLSSLPAWRTLDPFPVLSNMGEEEEDEEDDDSLEALVAQDGDKPEATKQEENA